jgi:hypothetical protein
LLKLSNRHLEALTEMAGIRGLMAAELLQEYVERGLQAELARVQRAENKPSQRLIPFIHLEGDVDGNSSGALSGELAARAREDELDRE